MTMKKAPVYVDGVKIPDAIQAEIIARFMTPRDLKSFWESYRNARKADRTVQEPSDEMRKLAKLRKKMSAKDVAAQEKVEVFEVLRAVRKVAVWEYLNS